MTVRELKEAIEKHAVSPKLYALTGDPFLAWQYARGMSGGDWYPVDDLTKAFADGLDPDSWALCRAESPAFPKYVPEGSKAIAICKKADGLPEGALLIDFPAPEKWQVEDYASSLCPGVAREKVVWLCSACRHDPWRISGECLKIGAFPEGEQDAAFDMLNEGDAFSDIGVGDEFGLSDAIAGRDARKLAGALAEAGALGVEPMFLIRTLSTSIKRIMAVKMDPNPSPEKCGMSKKQFDFIRAKSAGKWSAGELVEAYSFLCSYDSELKAGRLPFDRKGDALAYIACRTLGAGK